MSVKIDKTVFSRSSNGAAYFAAGRQLYVLERNGSLNRTIDPADIEATETLVEGFSDEALTVSLGTGPFTSDADGHFNVFVTLDNYDLYAPADPNPLTRWQPAGGGVPAEVATLSAAVTALDARSDSLENSRAHLPLNVLDSLIPYVDVVADNGVTDNTAAVQARIDNVQATGTTPSRSLFFPHPPTEGNYYGFAGSLNFDNAYGLELIGEGGRRGPCRLEYTGTGTFISARNTNGCHLEKLYLSATDVNAACIVDFSNSGGPGVGADSTLNTAHLVWFRGASNASSITELVRLGQCTATTFRDCFFDGGLNCVRGNTHNQAAGGYSNSNKLDGCYFHNYSGYAVRNPGQNWTLVANTFEPRLSGLAGAVMVDSGYEVQQITFVGNSFQDVSPTGGDWVTLRGATHGGATFDGNYFFGNAARHIVFVGAFDGVSLTGNTLQEADTAAVDCGTTGVTNFHEAGNAWLQNAADMIGIVNVDLGGILAPRDTVGPLGNVVWPAANRGHFVRFIPDRTISVLGVAYRVGVADAGNPTVDVAVLSGALGRLASSGPVTGKLNATGVQYVSFTAGVVLRAGRVYYVGMSTPSTTVQIVMGSTASGFDAELISSSAPHLEHGSVDGIATIPTTVSSLASSILQPRLALRAG